MATNKYSTSTSETGKLYIVTENNPWLGSNYTSYDTNEGGGYHFRKYPDGSFKMFSNKTGEYLPVNDDEQIEYLQNRSNILDQNSNNEKVNLLGRMMPLKLLNTKFGNFIGHLEQGGTMNYSLYLQEGGQVSQIEDQVAQLVLAAMSGSQEAQQQVEQIMQAAQQGDPEAQQIAQLIQQVAELLQAQTNETASMKCGGKVRAKVKKAKCGKKMEDGAKVPVAKKGCPCQYRKVGGHLQLVDCNGVPMAKEGTILKFQQPSGPIKYRPFGIFGVTSLKYDPTTGKIYSSRYLPESADYSNAWEEINFDALKDIRGSKEFLQKIYNQGISRIGDINIDNLGNYSRGLFGSGQYNRYTYNNGYSYYDRDGRKQNIEFNDLYLEALQDPELMRWLSTHNTSGFRGQEIDYNGGKALWDPVRGKYIMRIRTTPAPAAPTAPAAPEAPEAPATPATPAAPTAPAAAEAPAAPAAPALAGTSATIPIMSRVQLPTRKFTLPTALNVTFPITPTTTETTDPYTKSKTGVYLDAEGNIDWTRSVNPEEYRRSRLNDVQSAYAADMERLKSTFNGHMTPELTAAYWKTWRQLQNNKRAGRQQAKLAGREYLSAYNDYIYGQIGKAPDAGVEGEARTIPHSDKTVNPYFTYTSGNFKSGGKLKYTDYLQ